MFKKKLLGFLAAAVFLSALSCGAWADWDHHHYDGWWTSHHDYALQVQEHPTYLHDHAWLAHHHDVQVWLNANPGFVSRYVASPYPFVVVGHHEHDHWHQYPDHHWGW